jgi:coenzyme PQQ precursor peptide PqqA
MPQAGDLGHAGGSSGGASGKAPTKTKNETPRSLSLEDTIMKTWTKPAVREQEVGLEVTSYLPAEIDVI